MVYFRLPAWFAGARGKLRDVSGPVAKACCRAWPALPAVARVLSALVLVGGLFVTPSARAALITWDLSNVVLGAGYNSYPISGSFTFNTTTDQVISAYLTTTDPFNARTDYFDTSAGATVSSSNIGGFVIAQSSAEDAADTNGAHTLFFYVDTSADPAGLGDLVDPALTLTNDSAVATNGCCYGGAQAGSVFQNAADEIPEPASLVLFGIGVATLRFVRRPRSLARSNRGRRMMAG